VRNRDIPAEQDRRGTRFAWLAAVWVVPLIAFMVVRPFLAPRVPPGGLHGVVQSQGAVGSKWAPGGSRQWLKVRLADGRIVDAFADGQPVLAHGDDVVLRAATGGPFPYAAQQTPGSDWERVRHPRFRGDDG
jgi:hypothetical protein